MDDIKSIEPIIRDMSRLHDNFSDEFYNLPFLNDYNLKNLRKWDVTDAINDDFFMQTLIPKYRNTLESDNTLNFELLKLSAKVGSRFRYRVKLEDTIIIKLRHYSYKEKEIHGLYVSKCLNDVFGGRLILGNINSNSDKIQNLLKDLHDKKIINKFYHREDHGYKAFHCYFQSNNKVLPWELQIWDNQDCETNIRAHTQHERNRTMY